MLTRAYEFEIIRGEKYLMALPYDLEGGTQGEDFDDLCVMVADWLKVTLEDYDMRGAEPPRATYGNKPRHGGTNMVFGCTAGRETVDKVSASEAAHELGVTPGRISQMIAKNLLDGWREGRNTYVAVDSLRARKQDRQEKAKRHEKHPVVAPAS